MRYLAPKGVFDILPETTPLWQQSSNWQYLEHILTQCAEDYGFQEVRTPIFESSDLFIRSIGESSDIVNKEMYTFQDKAERFLTLRPEGTASVMRAYIEHKCFAQKEAHKWYYLGPMFRYERQQAGRYRQFHQFGAESIGCPLPEHDAEIVDLALQIYQRLGLTDLKVLINSVGNAQSRLHYKQALEAFLKPQYEALSSESKMRFEKNILRILDSKDPTDQELLQGCPSLLEFLDQESLDHFEKFKATLQNLGISYEVCPKLVRGLDYYNKSVFEIVSGSLGAQNAIAAGGRYDGLVASFGGPEKACVGFATGIERILLTLEAQNRLPPPSKAPFFYLIALGEGAMPHCFTLLSTLRHAKIPSEMQLPLKKIQHALSKASELKVPYCLILGDEELAKGVIKIKDLNTRQEAFLPIVELTRVALELRNSQTLQSTHQTIFGTL